MAVIGMVDTVGTADGTVAGIIKKLEKSQNQRFLLFIILFNVFAILDFHPVRMYEGTSFLVKHYIAAYYAKADDRAFDACSFEFQAQHRPIPDECMNNEERAIWWAKVRHNLEIQEMMHGLPILSVEDGWDV